MSTLAAKETSKLFRASCVALIATAMTFGVRADIMNALASRFDLSRAQTGWIAGAAFWGFTVAMFAAGQLCDLLGMRRLIAFGFVGHVLGILLTACAGGFWTLYAPGELDRTDHLAHLLSIAVCGWTGGAGDGGASCGCWSFRRG